MCHPVVVYGSAQGLDSTTRMALLVHKMEIFDKDFKQLFENNAAFNQLLYKSKMASFAPNNTPFDVRIFKAILAGLYYIW